MKWTQEKNTDRISSGKEHQKAIENLRKEHKKELDVSLNAFMSRAIRASLILIICSSGFRFGTNSIFLTSTL